MLSDEIVINVSNLSKRYEIYATPRDRLKQLVFPALYRLLFFFSLIPRAQAQIQAPKYFREFWALQNVSFKVRRGETVGVIGLNGSGKSTLLQMICSTLTPTSGNVDVKGRVAALLELGSGFNPEFTGRENVFLNGQILGLSREDVERKFKAIEEFADIGSFLDQPVKTYSSGMTVRLAFAVAIHVDPEVLVVDEALAVGDMAFQRKCLRWMEGFASKGGVLLFVSHSPEQVRRLCSKAIYLRNGVVADIGQAKAVCDKYEKDQYLKPFQDGEKADSQLTDVNEVNDIQVQDVIYNGFAECAVHYGDERAVITGAWTEDSAGMVRSSFQAGESFTWCYRVEFRCKTPSVVLGFMIKTKEGINLHGTNSEILGFEPYSVASGDSIIVRFSIEPNLGVGDYFLNCGVSIDNMGNSNFLHRVVDAGIVVISDNANASFGMVKMNVGMNIKTSKTDMVVIG